MPLPDTPVVTSTSTDVEFAEPWQLQAHAILHVLLENETLEPMSWSRAFGAQLAAVDNAEHPETADDYYKALIEALIVQLSGRSLLSNDELAIRTEAFRNAYLSTPHGHPVRLANAVEP